MRYRIWSLLLFGLSLSMALPGQANAVPTLFTDRAAFDAAVGSSTSLTLDAPSQTTADGARFTATYDQLMTFEFDRVGGVGVGGLDNIGNPGTGPGINPPGTVTLGNTGFFATGTVLQPVTAFGFDIVGPADRTISFADLLADGQRFRVPLLGVDFLGVVSSSPFLASVEYVPTLIQTHPLVSVPASPFTIDNVAIKAVPEPSALLLLGAGVLGVIGWHLRSRQDSPYC